MKALHSNINKGPPIYIYEGPHIIYVRGYGKTAHFTHYFKIELLVFKGSVDLKQKYAVDFLT